MTIQTILGGESFGYNGWLNYPTWRINMELCDCIGADLSESKTTFDSITELANHIKDYCENILENEKDIASYAQNFSFDYAMAFMQDVDWREIAEHIADDYSSLVLSGIDPNNHD